MPISFKKAAGKTSIKHNNRDFNEKDWKNDFHKHIDQERTPENVVIKQEHVRDAYDRIFGEALEKYNDKQTRKDRKIDDYYDHVKKSKTLNTQYEFIVQVGKLEDFADNSENWEIANDILVQYADEFQERNPNFEVYNAVIHNDEASPHLHLNVIPVAEGYKRGLERQPAFNKALENQGIALDTDSRTIFRNFREQEIGGLERQLNTKGIERQKVGTNNIQDHHEYKEMAREVDRMSLEVESARNDRNVLRDDQDSLRAEISVLKEGLTETEEQIVKRKQEIEKLTEGKQAKLSTEKLDVRYETKNVKVPSGEKFLGVDIKETKKQRTGNVVMPKKNFDELVKNYTDLQTAYQKAEKYLETDVVQENKQLADKVTNNAKIAYKTLDNLEEAHEEIDDLKEENKALKHQVQSLKGEIKTIYQTFKHYFTKGLKNDVERVKQVMRDFAQTISRELPTSEFRREDERENKPEKKRSRGPRL